MPARDDVEVNLVYAAINEDEELKLRIRKLAWNVVNKAEFLLENGNPTVQLSVMKNIMPAITRALTQQAEDDKYETLLHEFQDLRGELVGHITPIDAPELDDD